MLLKRGSNWYRPYEIRVNGKNYEVKEIKFYNNIEVVVSTRSGWLESKYGDITEINLPVEEIKQRRKEKFDGEVFIISSGKEYNNELMATLYIPTDILGVHFVKYDIFYNSQVRAVYEGNHDIYITEYKKVLMNT